MLSSSNRGALKLTDYLYPEAEPHLARFYTLIGKAIAAFPQEEGAEAEIDERFDRAMSDDFNTALALSDLFGYFKEVSRLLAEGDSRARRIVNQIIKTYSLLGLFRRDPSDYLARYAPAEEIPAEVKSVAEERFAARAAKRSSERDVMVEKSNHNGIREEEPREG